MVSCSRCNREAVVRLDYANADLCGPCFTRRFDRRVAKAQRDFSLFKKGDVVAVAISGGKDSAALLYSLLKLSKKGRFVVKPLLVDEGIAGYRNKAILQAKKLCKKLGLKLTVVLFKKLYRHSLDGIIKKRDRKHLDFRACTACGVLRKDALNKAARKLKATKVAVGHNADDIAQTFLMNALRADVNGFRRFGVVSGLSAQEKFVQRVKPLVYLLEKECALYCAVNDLPFYLGGCPYAGEAFRGEVKDFLNAVEQRHPGSKFNVLHSFLALKAGMSSVEGKGKQKGTQKAGTCVGCGEHSSSRKCRKCVLLDSVG